jgi:ribosome biogenesis GTPase A
MHLSGHPYFANHFPPPVLPAAAGLVLPKFARSRAEMVAAGVIPIDRLTDIRGPVEVVASRCGRKQVIILAILSNAPYQ